MTVSCLLVVAACGSSESKNFPVGTRWVEVDWNGFTGSTEVEREDTRWWIGFFPDGYFAAHTRDVPPDRTGTWSLHGDTIELLPRDRATDPRLNLTWRLRRSGDNLVVESWGSFRGILGPITLHR
jgi:hypothetical protein